MTPGRSRSLLFVPGNRPDRFAKARASGADLVCVDLEDAVAHGAAKTEARQTVLDALGRGDLTGGGGARVVLRINSPRTPPGREDVLALQRFSGPLPPIVVPKIETADELTALDRELGRPASAPLVVLPMIETALGLEAAADIARALPPGRMLALFFGAVDLAAELGCALAWEPLLYARSRIVLAATLAGIPAIDTPVLEVGNTAALEAEARRAADLGFTGKAAIHPIQVAPIHRGFAPTPSEIARARMAVEAWEKMGGGVALLEGRLIERPVYLAAQRLLLRASDDE